MENKKITKCAVCQTEMAKSAKTCPSCGAKNKKPIYKKWWCWLIVFVVAVGIISGGGNSGSNDDSSKSASKSANTEIKTEEKAAPTDVTVDTLVSTLEDNALNASNTYKDKYVSVTGKLTNIDSSGDYFNLGVTSGEFTMYSVQCYITDKQKDAVAAFKTGQDVTVIGTITDVGEVLGYSLDVETIK